MDRIMWSERKFWEEIICFILHFKKNITTWGSPRWIHRPWWLLVCLPDLIHLAARGEWKPRLDFLGHSLYLYHLCITKHSFACFFFLSLSSLFMVLGLELRAPHLLVRHSTTWTTLPVLFFVDFFEIECHELFAQLSLNLDPPDLCLLSS
jgi:hypothetical protein